MATLRAVISASSPSAIRLSCQLYQNITARKITVNGRSRITATAAPVRNSRIDSIPCMRAVSVPVGRCSKYGTGSENRCLNTRAAEHRVDAVAGVEHEVLPRPGHGRVEDEEQRQRHADDGERVQGVVHHHLVDDHLGEERRREPDQLEDERGDQHLPPDRAVLEELGHEPPEAEGSAPALDPGGRRGLVLGANDPGCEERLRLEDALPLRGRDAPRRFASRFEVHQPLGVSVDEDGRARRSRLAPLGRLHEREARKRSPLDRAVERDAAHAHAEAGGGADERVGRVRRRELLREQRRVERQPVQPGEALQRPEELRRSERHAASVSAIDPRSCPSLCRLVGTLPCCSGESEKEASKA